jgi:tetratricopeptide (TPR) repeat protein
VTDHYEAALQPLFEAVELAEQMGDLGDAQDHLSNLAVALQYLGRADEALRCLERSREFWVRMGRPEGLAQAANFVHTATAFMQAGRFKEALELLEWALQQFQRGRAEEWECTTRHRLARLFVRVGQFTRARQVLGQAGGAAEVDAGRWLARQRLLAILEAAEGRSGLAVLLAAAEAVPAEPNRQDRLMFEFAIAASEAPVRSLQLHESLAAHLTEAMVPARMRALIGRADALRRLGLGEEAASSAREAVALSARAEPLDLDAPSFWWMACEALRAGGDKAGAAGALHEGWRWLDVALTHLPPAFRHGFETRHRNELDVHPACVA